MFTNGLDRSNRLAWGLIPLLLMTWSLLSAAAQWTILVYMAADNGLSEFARQDINEMESTVLPAGTQVIVQVDFSELTTPSGCYRYKIRHDTTDDINSQPLANLGEINSGDWHNLRSFVQWGFQHYPATHKALVIWSHADSWYKDSQTKWLCPDNDSQSLMSVSDGDLRNALAGSPKLDILLLDACSLQSVEVVSEVADKADYVIASEDVVPAYGFPYLDILPVWTGTAANIAAQIPELYVNSYVAYGSQNPCPCAVRVSCSTLDTANWDAVKTALRSFWSFHYSSADQILAIRNQCYNLNTYNAEIDLTELLNRLAAAETDPNILAGTLALQDAINACLVSKAAIEYPVDLGALTIWYPFETNTFNNFWRRYLNLNIAPGGWTHFLSHSLGADLDQPPQPQILSARVLCNRLKVQYKIGLSPQIQRYYLRFVPDDQDTAGNDWLSEYALYTPSTQTGAFDLGEISCNGWLYLKTLDNYYHESVPDSIYVRYPAPQPELVVYPNPVKGGQLARLSWWLPAASQKARQADYQLRIYDISGKLVRSYDYSNQSAPETAFSTQNLTSGVYFAVLSQGKTHLKTRFAVVK